MKALTLKDGRRSTKKRMPTATKLAMASASALEPLEKRVLMTALTTIPYNTLGGTSSQNFSSLGSTASAAATISPNAYDLGTGTGTATSPGGSSLDGWSVYAPTALKYGVLNNSQGGTSTTTGAVNDYGSVNSESNRALGMVATSSSGVETISAEFLNNTSTTISQVNITYTGEEWNDGTTAGAKTLDFGYAVTGSPGNTGSAPAGITADSSLNFVSPISTGVGTALDGTLAANQQQFTSIPVTGLSWGAGKVLWLEWTISSTTGQEPGLAIANFSLSTPAAAGPTIGTQPSNQTVVAGSTATFTAAATDTDSSTPTVQWYEGAVGSGTAITGATSPSLMVTNTDPSENGYTYYAVFTNPNTLLTSTTNVATLTVDSAPTITIQPTAQTAAVGSTASFVAAASGTPTPTVQWYSDTTGLNSGGMPVMGATSAAYPVMATTALNGTYYYAVFSNTNVNNVTNTATTNAVELTTVTTAHTITQWSFTQTQAPVVFSPPPSFGSGTLTPLKMANNYNNGNSNDDEDITNSATTSTTNTGFNEDTWRVRGLASGGQNNGWSNSAPEYTQGAEVDVPVSGYDDFAFSFDWYSTTQGVRDLQVQYFDPTLNSGSGTWVNYGSPYIATSDDFYGVSTNVNSTTGTGTPTPVFVNLQGISDLAGISTLKLRMVSAYDSSLPNIDDGNVLDSSSHGQYASAAVYAVNEQQELNFLNASSGTFTLSYDGETTSNITYTQGDADLTSSVGSASAIASALNALPAIIEAGGVKVINPAEGMDSGGNTADDYTVIFNDTANVPENAITANTSGMNAGTTLTVQANNNGVVQYNNTSGNWRFDNITVAGDLISNAPVIVTNPTNQTFTEGVSTSVTFNASAYSDTQATDLITVTWEDAPASDPTDFMPISGEQNLPTTISGGNSTASLTLTSSSPELVNGELIEAVFSNSIGSATTTAATLSVVPAVAPTITVNPTNTSVLLGDQASFTATETGGQPTPTVTWLENGNPVPTADIITTSGTTTETSTIVLTAGPADAGAQFEAVFSNAQGAYGPVTAGPATLTVLAPEAAIATWTFPSVEAAPYNTPASTTDYAGASNYEGLGTPGAALTTVGFPSPGSTAQNDNPDDDVASTQGTAESSFSENLWRVRNTASSSASAQGWDLTAPDDSQGIQLAVDTTGYSNVYMTFDWYCTSQGIRDMQEEYSLNGGSTWTALGSPLVATPNDYYGANQTEGVSHIPVVFDLTGVTTGGPNGTGANDNPELELRLVSAYDPTYTGAGAPTYTSATLSGGSPVPYNGTSGNWRFGNFSVDAIPDWLAPASAFGATWNPVNNTLSVTGPVTINADPGSNTTASPTAEPTISADGSLAVVTINPPDSGSAIDIHLAGLTLSGGASAVVSSVGATRSLTDYHLLVIGTTGATAAPAFNIDSTSTLDLADNDMAILYGTGTSPLDTIQSDLSSAYSGGTWTGTGLTSSAAKTSGGINALGYGEASTLGVTSFDGVAISGNAVLVKYTLVGDTTLSGSVGLGDSNKVISNLNASGDQWTDGSFDYSGTVGLGSYNDVLKNFNNTLANVLPGGAGGSPSNVTVALPPVTPAKKKKAK